MLSARNGGAEIDGVGDDAFDALDRREPADVGDIGGLRGPRRNRAGAGGDELHESSDGCRGAARAVGEEFFKDALLVGGECGGEFGDVYEVGAHGAGGEAGGDQVVEKFLDPERREGG